MSSEGDTSDECLVCGVVMDYRDLEQRMQKKQQEESRVIINTILDKDGNIVPLYLSSYLAEQSLMLKRLQADIQRMIPKTGLVMSEDGDL